MSIATEHTGEAADTLRAAAEILDPTSEPTRSGRGWRGSVAPPTACVGGRRRLAKTSPAISKRAVRGAMKFPVEKHYAVTRAPSTPSSQPFDEFGPRPERASPFNNPTKGSSDDPD